MHSTAHRQPTLSLVAQPALRCISTHPSQQEERGKGFSLSQETSKKIHLPSFLQVSIPQASASLVRYAGLRKEASQNVATGCVVPGVIKELNCSLLGALGQL